jgi:hypothetical protein
MVTSRTCRDSTSTLDRRGYYAWQERGPSLVGLVPRHVVGDQHLHPSSSHQCSHPPHVRLCSVLVCMHDAPHIARLVHHTRKCLFSRHDPPVVCRVAAEEDPRPVCGRACEDVDMANDMTCVHLSLDPFFSARDPPGASTMYRLPSPKKSNACGYGPIDVFRSDLDTNRARSTGMAVDEKTASGFPGYPSTSSSRHPSPTINVAFVNGVWSPMLHHHARRIKTLRLV